jgi:hypothetical protein
MKKLALLPVLFLFFACSSATSMEPARTFDCGPGHDIEIRAGIEGTRNNRMIEPGDQLSFVVEVANNSHDDVTVQSIRVDTKSESGRGAASPLDPVFKTVKQEIPQGKDHVFRFPTQFRNATIPMGDPRQLRNYESPSEMDVTVVLSNGDAYRCPFAL